MNSPQVTQESSKINNFKNLNKSNNSNKNAKKGNIKDLQKSDSYIDISVVNESKSVNTNKDKKSAKKKVPYSVCKQIPTSFKEFYDLYETDMTYYDAQVEWDAISDYILKTFAKLKKKVLEKPIVKNSKKMQYKLGKLDGSSLDILRYCDEADVEQVIDVRKNLDPDVKKTLNNFIKPLINSKEILIEEFVDMVNQRPLDIYAQELSTKKTSINDTEYSTHEKYMQSNQNSTAKFENQVQDSIMLSKHSSKEEFEEDLKEELIKISDVGSSFFGKLKENAKELSKNKSFVNDFKKFDYIKDILEDKSYKQESIKPILSMVDKDNAEQKKYVEDFALHQMINFKLIDLLKYRETIVVELDIVQKTVDRMIFEKNNLDRNDINDPTNTELSQKIENQIYNEIINSESVLEKLESRLKGLETSGVKKNLNSNAPNNGQKTFIDKNIKSLQKSKQFTKEKNKDPDSPEIKHPDGLPKINLDNNFNMLKKSQDSARFIAIEESFRENGKKKTKMAGTIEDIRRSAEDWLDKKKRKRQKNQFDFYNQERSFIT